MQGKCSVCIFSCLLLMGCAIYWAVSFSYPGRTYLYILDINHLLRTFTANNFSRSVNCPFYSMQWYFFNVLKSFPCSYISFLLSRAF